MSDHLPRGGKMTTKHKIALLLLRFTLGAVFLIFGVGKFQNDIWAQTIRNMDLFQRLPWSLDLTVFLIGITETITGAGLIFGIFTRFFAAIAAVQLLGILILLKFEETRDIGLRGAAIYLALVGDDTWGLGHILKRKAV
jgi:uncharacterized membrane protein YphA (DoxX/SURF4 family)